MSQNNDVPFDAALTGNNVMVGGPAESVASAGSSYPAQPQSETFYQAAPPQPRRAVPMIDPVESAKMTPQILVFLVLAGLKRNWKWTVPLGLFMSLIAAGSLFLALPVQYEAKAWIQILANKPRFIFDDKTQIKYDEFVNTQIALIHSPVILDRALENPDVAKLPCVVREKDNKYGWLTKKLLVKPDGKSEMVIVSIQTHLPEEAEKIVNAAVDTYFEYYASQSMENDQKLITQLNAEIARQSQQARMYQDRIRAKVEAAASQGAAAVDGLVGGGDSLMRDVALNESKLTSLRAGRKALEEMMNEPSRIPQAFLLQAIQNDPDLMKITASLDDLTRRREQIRSILIRPDDPKMMQYNRDIEELEKQKSALLTGGEGAKGRQIQMLLRAQMEQQIWERDMEIRTQEIFVKELQEKYIDQKTKNTNRATNVADVAFDEADLARTNHVLDLLSERLVTLQAERTAPTQIQLKKRATLPASANTTKQVMMISVGSVACFCFPLLLGIAVERLKPRLYHVSQIRRAIPQVLIGEIMEPPVSWIHGATFRKRLARYRESVHNWCTHLLLSNPFRECKTLSVASVAGDDGKTFLAVQIAVAMAQMKSGPVLLIDGDMRVGRLHLLFGNEETGVGLADVLSFKNGIGEAIVSNEKEPNLHLLSAGQLDVSPYELLGDGRFRELLEALEARYSLILVVLPPVANAAESLVMASSTNSVLLCVRQGETVLAAMEDVFRKLVNTGSYVDGIVVKDIPYYQMAAKDGGFADKLEQIRLAHLLQYAD